MISPISLSRYQKAMDDICSMVINSEEYITKEDVISKLEMTRDQINLYLELFRKEGRLI
jgi:hypothetical protein